MLSAEAIVSDAFASCSIARYHVRVVVRTAPAVLMYVAAAPIAANRFPSPADRERQSFISARHANASAFRGPRSIFEIIHSSRAIRSRAARRCSLCRFAVLFLAIAEETNDLNDSPFSAATLLMQ